MKRALIPCFVLFALLGANAILVGRETAKADQNTVPASIIETANGALQVVLDGCAETNRPTMLLIHGYASSLAWWGKLIPLLERDYCLVSVDLLGHGGSEKRLSGYRMEDQADALAEVLNKLKIQRVVVVGHSMGGAVATAFAQRHSDRATHVVILDTSPRPGGARLSTMARLMRLPLIGQAMKRLSDVLPASYIRKNYRQAFAPGFEPERGFSNPDQVVHDVRAVNYAAYDQSRAHYDEMVRVMGLDERLAATHKPLLVIYGELDQIKVDVAADLAVWREVPGAVVVSLAGVGHSPQIEVPAVVESQLRLFLAR